MVSLRRPFAYDAVSKALEIVGNNERFILWETEERKEKLIASALEPDGVKGFAGRWDWEPWTEVGRQSPITYVPFSMMNRWRLAKLDATNFLFEGKRAEGLMLSFGRFGSRALGPFPDHDQDKRDFLLQVWERVVNLFQPQFALMDDFGLNVMKRRRKDLSAFAWGVTIYGPELVARVGRDRLMSAPAFQVKELPWGGVWIQVSENPFQAPPEAKKALEKHLNLKQLPIVA
jgi:hypothetical protein